MFFTSSINFGLFRAAIVFTFLIFCSVLAQAQFVTDFAGRAAIDPRAANPKNERYHSDFSANVPPVETADSQSENVPFAAGELDASFKADIFTEPGIVRSTALQPDGKIIVGGYFRTLNENRYNNLARLNADYKLDPSFTARTNGTVASIAVQTDGKIIIGGSFTAVNGTARNRIARLNSDGSLDSGFNPGLGVEGGNVNDVLVQADGKILLGGNFFVVNDTANYGVARLNADGTVDPTFTSPIPFPAGNPSPIPSSVFSLAQQADGKIILGGLIVRNYMPTMVFTSIVRLNTNGSIDTTFNPGNFNSNLYDVAVQPDGKIIVAGFFSSIGGVARKGIARLNPNGSLDESFNPGNGANSPIYTIYLQSNGAILIGGAFFIFNGVDRTGLARLNADGSLDNSFVPTGNIFVSRIYSVIQTPNGKILAAADTFGFDDANDSIIVYNANGSIDSSARYSSTATGGVRAVAAQPDGKILIGGSFTTVNNKFCNHLARLNPDGSLDESFGTPSPGTATSSTAYGVVNSIVLQPDGKILVGGLNVKVGELSSANIKRLNTDGTDDNSFTISNLSPIGEITDIALQSNGKIVVTFKDPRGNNRSQVNGVARLNADGSIDSTFNSAVSLPFSTVAIQADGKILVGGSTSICFVDSRTGSVCYVGALRLNTDGTLDTDFRANFSNNSNRFSSVYALALQPDGKILAGGHIFAGDSQTATGVVRLNPNGSVDASFNSGAITNPAEMPRVEDLLLLPNGKIVVGGLFSSLNGAARNNVARLNSDGSLDSSFNAATDNGVYKVALQRDGKILIGGDFESVNNVARTVVARLNSEQIVQRNVPFDFDGDGRSDVGVFRQGFWYVQRSRAGFYAIQFGTATDKLTPADYDGDGKTDVAVFRDGYWYITESSTNQFRAIHFGQAGDVPVLGDYDGDGRADAAVFRSGFWYFLNSSNNAFRAIQFGISGDKPVPADYDGDNRTDVAVFRDGNWYGINSSTNQFQAVHFGIAGDRPVPADYDGDGKADQAVYRAGTWYMQRSSAGFTGVQFGNPTDTPVAADYDGDGKADVAVFRAGNWYRLSSANNQFVGEQFGIAADKPIEAAFLP